MSRVRPLRVLSIARPRALRRREKPPALVVVGRVVDGPKTTLRREVRLEVEGSHALLELAAAAADARVIGRRVDELRTSRTRVDELVDAAAELEKIAEVLRARASRLDSGGFRGLFLEAGLDRDAAWRDHAGLAEPAR